MLETRDQCGVVRGLGDAEVEETEGADTGVGKDFPGTFALGDQLVGRWLVGAALLTTAMMCGRIEAVGRSVYFWNTSSATGDSVVGSGMCQLWIRADLAEESMADVSGGDYWGIIGKLLLRVGLLLRIITLESEKPRGEIVQLRRRDTRRP